VLFRYKEKERKDQERRIDPERRINPERRIDLTTSRNQTNKGKEKFL
jgi:hypothetical protein